LFNLGLPALFVGLVLLESVVWPAAQAKPVPVGEGVPPVYRWLADQPPDPVLELPMAFTPEGPQLEYQYLSTYHWRTTPDGYSGFIPPKHGQVAYEMARFPSERSLSLLQGLGVSQVIIHSDRYPVAQWSEIEAALEQMAELTRLESFGADQVYGVQPRSFTPNVLEVHGYLPPHAGVGQPYVAYVIAINRGPRSYAVRPTDVVQAGARWESVEGPVAAGADSVEGDVPLVISPEGGAAVIPLLLEAPPDPGAYRLAISEQDGPLGEWTLDGEVQVGDEADKAFPAPAQLLAWTVPEKAQPGQPLPVDLTWRALGKIDAYYSLYVKLLDVGGNAITGWDGQPRDGEAPTLLWVPGEVLDDTVTLLVPADAAPGDYLIEVGMYRAKDLARVLTLNGDAVPVDRVVLGTVRIGP
jgi:hypothetical protein